MSDTSDEEEDDGMNAFTRAINTRYECDSPIRKP